MVARLDRAHADAGTRLKAAIQEAGTPPPPWGLVGQSASLDPNVRSGAWALSGSYGAFTPFIHLAARGVKPGRIGTARSGSASCASLPATPARRRRPTRARTSALRSRQAPARLRAGPGVSSTFNLVQGLPHLEEQRITVKVVAAISEELFDRQPQAYRDAVLPAAGKND